MKSNSRYVIMLSVLFIGLILLLQMPGMKRFIKNSVTEMHYKVRKSGDWFLKNKTGYGMLKTVFDKVKKWQKPKYCNIYEWNRPIEENFTCVPLKSIPSTPICLHDRKRDTVITGSILSTGMWEAGHVRSVQAVLRSDPDMGLIDVGCNIGVFSVIAARMGRRVVSVEPNLDNIKRLHRAVQIGHLEDRIVLVHNAISDTRGRGTLTLHPTNQGDTRVKTQKANNSSQAGGVGIITMDDLLEVIDFKKAVIKMDVQGYEHRAIVGAKKLLDNIYIPYIFMEWVLLSGSKEVNLVQELINQLTRRGYKTFTPGGQPLAPNEYKSWTWDVVWRHKNAFSIWG